MHWTLPQVRALSVDEYQVLVALLNRDAEGRDERGDFAEITETMMGAAREAD
jgi:hypothetical protein